MPCVAGTVTLRGVDCCISGVHPRNVCIVVCIRIWFVVWILISILICICINCRMVEVASQLDMLDKTSVAAANGSELLDSEVARAISDEQPKIGSCAESQYLVSTPIFCG